MASADREPPPLFEDDQDDQKNGEIAEQTPEDEPAKLDAEEEKSDDLFSGGGTEVSLDDESPAAKLEPEQIPEPEPLKEETSKEIKSEVKEPEPATVSASGDTEVSAAKKKEEPEEDDDDDEEERRDTFDMEISITDPQRIGDGMGAYVAYKVSTTTSDPAFKKADMSVMRRFSDFLGLHQKLVTGHASKGRIVPPAPEKSVVGMTKVKMSKSQEDTNSMDFIEKRRASLERFLNRTAAHPILRKDGDFREFLEVENLPKATNTSALSGAGMMRVLNRVVDTASKMTGKMNESDQWFEEKHQHIESLDQQLRKLHSSVENMVTHRKELAGSTQLFAKSAAMLGNSEEHTALSRAISQLAETEEKIENLHVEQANTDFYVFSELLKDYIGLIAAVREAFREREKAYHTWTNAQAMLVKKRENEAKFKTQGKPDKVYMAQEEIKEWEGKVEKGQEDFEAISKTLRKEVNRFEENRVRDFRSVIIKYLEALMHHQQQLIGYWEGFLPEAKAIA
ncbi:sorting nexin-2-like isoform X2 [Amphiura filiformis]|uniref:sorting nexin-2-like isoform X2 n=1 Tax=Amphiura filiformis TaxID=82378 RepID=UPI003B211C15